MKDLLAIAGGLFLILAGSFLLSAMTLPQFIDYIWDSLTGIVSGLVVEWRFVLGYALIVLGIIVIMLSAAEQPRKIEEADEDSPIHD